MSCKLIITPHKEGILCALYQDGKPVELHYQQPQTESVLGNIYVGRVRDVVKNIKAAFIDLGNGKKAYYSLEEKNTPFYTKKGSSSQIQQGDELLVQIKKDAVKTKDPVVTTEISLSSVYFVGMIGTEQITCSSKIPQEDRLRLRHWALEHVSGIGLIIRTNAANATEQELSEDLQRLTEQLSSIKAIAPFRPAGTLLYKGNTAFLSVIKNLNQSLNPEIITDSRECYEQIHTYLAMELPRLLPSLRFYEDRLLPLDKLYSVESAVSEAFSERIWLKCGGYLVIQETEALTVVDVNSGKCAVKKDPEETFYKVNIEAAAETARQLRLRNISGIIIVDFINLKHKEAQTQLLEYFQQHLKNDPIPAQVVDITSLGLIEVTRKRTKGTISEQFLRKE